jgi:hypothetical protein
LVNRASEVVGIDEVSMPEQDLDLGDGLGDAAVKPTDGDEFGEEKVKSRDYDSLAKKVFGRQPKDTHYDETNSQKPKAPGSDVRNRDKNAKKVPDPFGDPYAGEAQPKKKNSVRHKPGMLKDHLRDRNREQEAEEDGDPDGDADGEDESKEFGLDSRDNRSESDARKSNQSQDDSPADKRSRNGALGWDDDSPEDKQRSNHAFLDDTADKPYEQKPDEHAFNYNANKKPRTRKAKRMPKSKMSSMGYINDTHDEDLRKGEQGDMVLGGDQKRSLFKQKNSKGKRNKKKKMGHKKFDVFEKRRRRRGLKQSGSSEQNYIYKNALHHKWSSNGKKKSRN